MRNKTIKQKKLVSILEDLGFNKVRTKGSHMIFSNSKYNATVVMRSFKRNEPISEMHLASVRKTIIEKGIVTQEEWNELLIDQ